MKGRSWQRVLGLIVGLGLTGAGWATQVCTTTEFGNKDFNGISGVADNNVFAVGKDGNIVRWDGSVWAGVASPTTEDLLDVEFVSPAVAYAVGKKGTILHWDGVGWTVEPAPDDKELNGVWSNASDEAWAVGKNGKVHYWDGSAWTDVSIAADTDGKELVDAWGDSNSFYALSKKGVLHRYDRNNSTWDAPDDTCDVGGGNFEDLWGDGAGNIYLVKKKEVYLYDGSSCSVVATASKDLLGIYGSPVNIVAVGKDGRVMEDNGAGWFETDEGVDDFRDVWVSESGNAYYAGKKGELTACQCIDCIVPGLVIAHDGFGIHCLDEAVTIHVVDTVSGNPYSGYAGPVTLDTQSGFGTWLRTGGSGPFSDPVADDGLAGYTFPGGESSASFLLQYPQGPAVLDIDAYETGDPSMRDDDSEGALAYSASGFTVTATALSNPPPAVIAPFAGPVTAGADFILHLTAFGQLPADPQCGVIESYDGARSLKFWSTYLNPATGSVAVAIDGAAIANAEGGAAAQAVSFTNGQATVSARYKDAGRIRISLKDDTLAHPDLPTGIRGATSPFVSRPARFVLSNIRNGALPNPGAVDATGPVFVKAGDPFSVTVTAVDMAGDPTPNYGREAIAESVGLTSVLVDPAAGNNPPLAAPAGFGAFTGGSATGTDFSWPEVGIIRLSPAVADGDYLGAGNVTGTTSANVGRFIPHHFATAVNAPVFDTACDAGAFTYIGQTFDYTVAPAITVTAEAADNATTQNYTSAYWKLTNTSLANRVYAAGVGMLDTGGLPAPATDPVIVDAGAGTGTLTFSAGTGLKFQRSAPQAPFDADIGLAIDVIDSDAVTATVNPVSFGLPGGIAFDAGREQRYGRVAIASALGSELVDLGVPMQSQYYVNAATGFTVNAADACSTAVTLSFSGFAGNLAPGETCVMDAGSPGASGVGCAAPAPLLRRYREPPLAGDFNLNLAAPGAGNDGALTVTATVPAWLRFDWDQSLAGDEDPAGRVTFGIFRGRDETIYRREIY